MGQNISSLISAGGAEWVLAAEEAKRQAIASLRGYSYQLHQSLAAWIALPEGATLHLEVAEDYAAIARDPATLEEVLAATQVKDKRESGSVTLNSADVLEAIANFWSLREANEGRKVRFAFLTTSPIGKERRAPLPSGTPGLEVWATAARGGPVDELRAALKERLADHAGIAALLADASDDELCETLIAPIRFVCGAPDIAGVEADNRAALVELGYELGGTPELAARAADHLLVRVLDTVIESADRRLTRGDLIQQLFDLITIRVPSRMAIGAGGLTARGIDLDATGAWRAAAPPQGPFAPRSVAVDAIGAIAAEHGVAWIHGSTGLGKSILAELAAARHGSAWRVLDLRGASGPVARERLAAARAHILAAPDIVGLVVDDLSPDLEAEILSELSALAATLARRDTPLLVTSNHPPSHRIARATGAVDAAVFAAPSFDESDAAELVAAYRGDPAKWAWFALLVGGAHPQLVDAAIAGLERRGWPDSAMEEWAEAGMRNSDVEAEREAARRRLLAELTGDTLPLLARTARIIGTFDRPLAVAVGEAMPALERIGLSLDQLTGHWIERVGSRGLRTSPLVSGLDRETFSADELKAIDEAICAHLLKRTAISPDLIDLAFAHAIFAQNGGVVNMIVQMVITSTDENRPKLASAMTLFRRADAGLGFLDEYPLQRLLLLLAQHLLLSSIGSADDVDRSAERLVERLDAATKSPDARPEAEEAAAGIVFMKMLMDGYAFGKIRDWFPLLRRFRTIAEAKASYAHLFETKLERDPIQFMFLAHAVYLPGRPALSDLFGNLDGLAPDERRYWLASLSTQPGATSMFVDNAWMKEVEKGDVDGTGEAAELERLADMAIGWGEPALAGKLFRAQSVMLDEYAGDRAGADAALDTAGAKLPGSFEILRSRAKVAWRADDHPKVVAITKELTGRLDDVEAIEAAFVLREGAMSAGELELYDQARRWFEAAEHRARETRSASDVFATGLAADAVWAAFAAGDRAGAVRAMAGVLERLETIDPAMSETARALHLLSRHLVLWMRAQDEDIRIDDGPVLFVPGAISNPSPNPGLAAQPLSRLAPAWMMLARAALRAGVPPAEVLDWAGVADSRRYPAHDVMIRTDLLNYGIERQSIEDFSRFLVPHVEGIQYIAESDWQQNPPDPVNAVPGTLPTLTADKLADDLVRSSLRDSALAYGAVSLKGGLAQPHSLGMVRGVVHEVAEADLLPEWSDTPPAEATDLGSAAAESIARLAAHKTLTLEQLFVAHLRVLEWANGSHHRAVALAALASRVRSDWRHVLDERRALLRLPAATIPEIETALTADHRPGSYAANVLLAVLSAVSVNLAPGIRAMLADMRDRTDDRRPHTAS